MNATHRHKTSGVEVSAHRLDEPVTVSLADGDHDFEAGDYEVTQDGAVVMATADEFEENFDPILPAPRNLQTIIDAQREQEKQPAADPDPPEAA